MSTTTTSARDCRAYLDLEPKIRDLARMAEIVRFYVSETPLPPGFNEGQMIEADRVCFAISHIADMAGDLVQAYDKHLRKEGAL